MPLILVSHLAYAQTGETKNELTCDPDIILSKGARWLYSDKEWVSPEGCESIAKGVDNARAFYFASGDYLKQMRKLCTQQNHQWTNTYTLGNQICTLTINYTYTPIWPDACYNTQVDILKDQCINDLKQLCEKYITKVRSSMNSNGRVRLHVGIGEEIPCKESKISSKSCIPLI